MTKLNVFAVCIATFFLVLSTLHAGWLIASSSLHSLSRGC